MTNTEPAWAEISITFKTQIIGADVPDSKSILVRSGTIHWIDPTDNTCWSHALSQEHVPEGCAVDEVFFIRYWDDAEKALEGVDNE